MHARAVLAATWLRRAVALALATSAFTAPACQHETPEAAIRRVLGDAVGAMERQDVKAATAHLSSQYRDRMGRDARQVSAIALFALRRGPVYVLLRDTTIEVDDDVAKVATVAYAFQRKPDPKELRDLVPTHADRFELKLLLAREGSAWRVRSIDGDGISPDWARE
jgi:hypothetical protein